MREPEHHLPVPFSLTGKQPLHCGFPAFQLTCDANRTYFSRTFRDRLYHVLHIFYDNSSLVVAVESTFADDDRCNARSRPDFNVSSSLALLPLNISTTNRNLTFIYNCEVPGNLKLPAGACPNHTMGA
ncbi:hypothetical protein PVAP13_3KG263300 [Panicum virgatum]|uniref:Wall-associated receptor kinase galacturonan-binding domain-containing protein n=1 Tax=Panicum virgatum TaxID=38727 RepID=A0A8T0V5T8_PANVG|nr:hypothetical protein PVAP13_3KG263300 [Panicum virgatum]